MGGGFADTDLPANDDDDYTLINEPESIVMHSTVLLSRILLFDFLDGNKT